MTSTSTDRVIMLSPLDTVMESIGIMILYIFPPPTSTHFDLKRLHSSFISLVDHDYTFLIGKFHVDPTTGIACVKQTAESVRVGATGIRFEMDPQNPLTTELATRKLSLDLMPTTRDKEELFCVKASLLTDGGMTIGIDATHVLFDAEAFSTFMKGWGQYYSGVKPDERLVVNHDRYLLNGTGKPSEMQHLEFQAKATEKAKDEAQLLPQAPPPSAQHFFHFNSKMMKRIKEVASNVEGKGSNPSEVSYVSTVDAITALMTILITRARGHGQDVKITTCVNARRHLHPPLPQNYVGNAIFNALSMYQNSELQPQPEDIELVSPAILSRLARRVRSSIVQCNEKYMQDTINFLTEQKSVIDMKIGTNFVFGPDLFFTSWLHLGMYDAEFEDVHPVYACVPQMPDFDGLVILTEARNGEEGIDMLVFLECNAMEKLKIMLNNISYLYD